MNDIKYNVFVDDGSNKTIHEIFASSIEQAKMIIINNGIPPDNIINIIEDKPQINSNQQTIKKTIKNPFTGDTEIVEEQVDQINEKPKEQLNLPQKIYNLNGVEVAIINNEMYTQSWSDIEDSDQYRILNIKNEKTIKNENYKIQKRTWIKLSTNDNTK